MKTVIGAAVVVALVLMACQPSEQQVPDAPAVEPAPAPEPVPADDLEDIEGDLDELEDLSQGIDDSGLQGLDEDLEQI